MESAGCCCHRDYAKNDENMRCFHSISGDTVCEQPQYGAHHKCIYKTIFFTIIVCFQHKGVIYQCIEDGQTTIYDQEQIHRGTIKKVLNNHTDHHTDKDKHHRKYKTLTLMWRKYCQCFFAFHCGFFSPS